MKIALITYPFYPQIGGVAHTLTCLCKSFQNTEHDLFVFNPSFRGKKIFDSLINVNLLKKSKISVLIKIVKFSKRNFNIITKVFWKIIKNKKYRGKFFYQFCVKPLEVILALSNIVKLYPYFKKIKFDLILGGYAGVTLLVIYILSKVIFNKKAVSFVHGNDFLESGRFSFKGFYFQNLDKIILHTQSLKKLIRKMYNLNNELFEILPTGLIVQNYDVKETKANLRERYGITKNSFVILSVGSHVPRKNFDLIIKAINRIKVERKISNIKYYLIGIGESTPFLKALTKKFKLYEEIVFLGKIDNKTRNNYYKLSDVLIMPSISKHNSIEGFGVVFLEANYFKLAVIGTPSGGISEAILDGKTGLLVEPNNLEDLTEKILYLIDNKTIRLEMGQNGYNRVLDELNWKQLYLDYSKTFDNVIN